MVKRIFEKTFNIREGEIRIVFLMQLYIFLIITVLLLVKPTVTALFLSNLGSGQLPYGYLLVAVVAVLSSMTYNRMVKIFSIKTIASFTLIIFSIFFFVLSYVVYKGINYTWILYFYYLSISLFGVLATSQFWVIANIVFDLREAKRLFGFIGAGAIAGGIFGGYLTTLLANYFGNGIVILTASILLLLCLPIILIIWRIRKEQVYKYTNEEDHEDHKSTFDSSFGKVLKSKHLVNLAAVVGVSVLVAKLIDFQFSDFAHKAFTDSNELASFFGFWFSSFNIIALLIQLFLTNKLLSRFGVSSNLMILPVSLAIGSVLFLVFPELWVLILIKGVDGSFKQSINKAAFELSFLPVSYESKKHAKPFIDVVVDSIATGIAGFLLLFVIKALNVDTKYITMITIFFLLIWFYMIYRLRSSYFDTFRKNIREIISREDLNLGHKKKNNRVAMKAVLNDGNENEIVKLLDHMDAEQIKIYKSSIINLIDHPSDKVKASAIKSVYTFRSKVIVSKIKTLLEVNTDDVVVYESMEYLLIYSNDYQNDIYRNYLDHKKDYLKNAALLCLARASRVNNILANKYHLDKRIEDQIEEFTIYEDKQRRVELIGLLLTIGYSEREKYYSFIDKYLKSKDPVLKKYAIKAAGLTKHEQYISQLIRMIIRKEHAGDVIEALKNFGKPIVQKLYIMIENEELDENTRGFIPKILESYDSKQSVVTLLNLLQSNDVLVRLNTTKSLKILMDKDIKLKLNNDRLNENIFSECLFFKNTLSAISSLEKTEKRNLNRGKKLKDKNLSKEEDTARRSLIDLLQKHLDLSLQTIFFLLSEKYKFSDMEVVFLGIKNDTEESRINAIEFLSNLLDTELKNELLPILEYHFLSDKNVNLKIDILPEKKCLNNLLKDCGVATKVRVLKLMQQMDQKGSVRLLNKLAKHKNTTVRNLAKKILYSTEN